MYDNICKLIAEEYPEDFAAWLLGKAIALTELKPTELSSEPIRADSLVLLQSEDLVLHLEFQTKVDPQMAFRMLDYRVRLYRRYPQKKVVQVVLYLCATRSPLAYQEQFELEQTTHHFRVVRLWEEATSTFLQVPGLLPFAVLSQTTDPVATLRQVSGELDKIGDDAQKHNTKASAFVLAGLKLEEQVIQQILRNELMRESVTYQAILREGREEGRREGREEAREESKRAIAMNMLKNMNLSIDQVAYATSLPLVVVQEIADALAE